MLGFELLADVRVFNRESSAFCNVLECLCGWLPVTWARRPTELRASSTHNYPNSFLENTKGQALA